VTVVGQGGQGKSTLLEGSTQHNVTGIVPTLARRGRVIVYDRAAAVNVGLRFDSAEQMRLYMIAAAKGRINNPATVLRLVPTTRANDSAFSHLCTLVSDCWIVVDEAMTIAPSRRINDHLLDAVNYGRNRGVGFVFASRRYMQTHPSIREEAQAIISFWRRDASKYVPDREAAKAIQSLQEHHALSIGALPTELKPVLDSPTIDSFA